MHMVVEIASPGNRDRWRHAASIRCVRDYIVFGEFARGIRSCGSMGSFEPRGFPRDVDFTTLDKYGIFIVDNNHHNVYNDVHISEDEAEEYVMRGLSEYLNDRRSFISHPDNHTPSWLLTEEVETALQNAKSIWRGRQRIPAEYWALIPYLKTFEEEHYRARIVFWFDN